MLLGLHVGRGLLSNQVGTEPTMVAEELYRAVNRLPTASRRDLSSPLLFVTMPIPTGSHPVTFVRRQSRLRSPIFAIIVLRSAGLSTLL